MLQTFSSFQTFTRAARLLGLSLLVACVCMLSASAQQFADFETGMDGFTVAAGTASNHTVTAATSNLVATSGVNSLCVSKTPDGFSWAIEVSGTASTGNTNFYNAVDAARNDPTNAYELVFDAIYVSNAIPNAGTTNIGWINFQVAMQDDAASWEQADPVGVGSDVLQNLSSNEAHEARVALSNYEGLSKSTTSYQMIIALNGNWGTNDAVSIYFDNFRVEPKNYVFYDFQDSVQGWTFDEGCGLTVGWRTNFPGMEGEGMLFLDHDLPGPCRSGKGSPGAGNPGHTLLVDAVNDDPSMYNLEFDFNLRRDYLPGDATFVRPMIGIFGDGLGWEGGKVLTELEVDLTTLTGTTSIHASVRLDTLRTLWPAPGWDPTWVQYQAGKDIDGTGLNGVYYDNFALVPVFVPEAEESVITDLAVNDDVAVTWDSSAGYYYQVEHATSLNPDWAPVSGYSAATPPQNTWTGAVAAGSPSFYRVGATLEPVEVLFDFETDEEGWAVFGAPDNSNSFVVATNLFPTSGSNSLAVAQDVTSFRWNTQYASSDPLESDPLWIAVSNAWASGEDWYLATDVTINGPDILGAGVWGVQVFFAFNSLGGWTQFNNAINLGSSTVLNLQNNSNSVTVTWSVPLEDTQWFASPTNDFLEINVGNNGNFTGLTTYLDNWRLTTVQP